MTNPEEFLKDVCEHTMTVELDQGVHRSIRFAERGSWIGSFRLNTWPGCLCISGDMGDFLFCRTDDMFDFFRNKNGSINPHYWGEKLQAISSTGGYRKYCPEKFTKRVTKHFESYKEYSSLSAEESTELWEAISDAVLIHAEDGEIFAYPAVRDFEHNGFSFEDFFDAGGTEDYSHQYIWCLYAIVWGIQRYDESKAQGAAA